MTAMQRQEWPLPVGKSIIGSSWETAVNRMKNTKGTNGRTDERQTLTNVFRVQYRQYFPTDSSIITPPR